MRSEHKYLRWGHKRQHDFLLVPLDHMRWRRPAALSQGPSSSPEDRPHGEKWRPAAMHGGHRGSSPQTCSKCINRTTTQINYFQISDTYKLWGYNFVIWKSLVWDDYARTDKKKQSLFYILSEIWAVFNSWLDQTKTNTTIFWANHWLARFEITFF